MISADQLRRDIMPFTDPATELRVNEGTHGIRAQFIRDGLEHDYFIDVRDQTVVARHAKGRKFISLRSLLASPDFADIRGLASTQQRILKDFAPETLIPPEGEIDGSNLTRIGLSKALSPTRTGDDDRIRIALVDGPAGVGKTSLIQSALVGRARRQQETNSLPPILHVASRGRRLAGLNDALAQSLQLVRARFTFDQTPILVRYGLLQVAIDGFDELVDPEGYRDAWFALRDFLSEIGAGGPIILAGRDTFFDQQSFQQQVAESQLNIAVCHLRLQPVSSSSAKHWLRQRGWSERDVEDPFTNLVLRPGSYALRPYFLSQLASARSWSAIHTRDLTPRAFLVDHFLEREASLVSEQIEVGRESVVQSLSSLFEEIALEMADNETDSVDLGFLRLVTEVAFGSVLFGPDLAKLQHKAGSFALLEKDPREGHRRFPHTEISNHFLASALIRVVSDGGQIRFLRRGVLTGDLLAIFAEILGRKSPEVVTRLYDRLSQWNSEDISGDRIHDNTSSLLISGLSYPVEEHRTFSDLAILDAVLFGVISPVKLDRIKFQRLDVREAELTRVEFTNCEVVSLMVDDTTRFGETWPRVHQLLVTKKDGDIKSVYEPGDIAKWLQRHSRPLQRSTGNAAALRLFERVCRVMLRQHMIKEHPTDQFGRLLQDELWPKIETILSDAEMIDRVEGKDSAGPSAPFLRLRDPYKLLVSRSEPTINNVWKRVAAIAA